MANTISEEELLEFLKRVEDGSVILVPADDPQDTFAGNVRYSASNGWGLVVFNDANEWDYIDEVETGDGRRLSFDEIESMPRASLYNPGDDVSWEKYGIPGYMKFRCGSCGTLLAGVPPCAQPLLCKNCADQKSAPNENAPPDSR